LQRSRHVDRYAAWNLAEFRRVDESRLIAHAGRVADSQSGAGCDGHTEAGRDGFSRAVLKRVARRKFECDTRCEFERVSRCRPEFVAGAGSIVAGRSVVRCRALSVDDLHAVRSNELRDGHPR
jgi:hypothetical protein